MVHWLTKTALTIAVLGASTGAVFGKALPAFATLPEPIVTPLAKPIDDAMGPKVSVLTARPSVVKPGGRAHEIATSPIPPLNPGQEPPATGETDGLDSGKAGTGFFVSGDGTLLTAAHVVSDCRRTQIISRIVPRTWVSVVASDVANDIAVLRAIDYRPPAFVPVSASPPVSRKVVILGYPGAGSLTVAAETSGVVENDKFPANIGQLGSPRHMLWLLAPEIGHGFSGGPIYDPRHGAVVGMVKGTVDGGFLRLVQGMPTAGVAIGPGAGTIGPFLRREAPFAALQMASDQSDGGVETLRRATVHVLCWK